ncbi:MAG: SpoIIE family protein phosphatase, partial [Cyanobacteria bacterium P01_D01_bin.128]
AIQKLLQQVLQSESYTLAFADRGEDGLRLARDVQPALIICDWVFPDGLDGLEVCRQIKADPAFETTFFMMLTARAGTAERVEGLEAGADDLLFKPVDFSELKARVKAGLRLHQLSQDLKHQKLLLEAEFTEAADYVRSLLPPRLEGAVPITAQFIPSSKLGGDCFDYHWLDPDYLAIYLLDVSGHGLGSALLSISVLNLLRSQSLPGVNFYRPEKVLAALNETFQMDDQHDKYFTIWYGIYSRSKRQLSYASAGHPPAVLISPQADGGVEVQKLRTPGMPVGILPDTRFNWQRCTVAPDSRLYVFSDGIYESQTVLPGGTVFDLDHFIKILADNPSANRVEDILATVQRDRNGELFDDDLSLLEVWLK